MDWKGIYKKLGKRTETYAVKVRAIMEKRIGEVISMCEGLELVDGKPFEFADYPDISRQVQATFRAMYSEIYQQVRGNITQEWYYSNADMDGLLQGLFGKGSIQDKHFARYFARNKEAMNAFFARKEQGMDLSQRVWAIAGNAKQDLEVALDLGLGQGLDAGDLSRKVRQYLKEPDMLFRRFRYKAGEDEDGNPVYKLKWKRRHYDKDTGSFYWLDDNPKNYHTGRGVYRSSYKNAMRLTRTETNMAYRTADCERWAQLEFVRGFKVVRSKNHMVEDICDQLSAADENDNSGKGVYPKGTIFKGWHPHCYCYMVPLLCSDDELEQLMGAILRGEDTSGFVPADVVEAPPAEFTQWIEDNQDRINSTIQQRGTGGLPYFLQDNFKDGNPANGYRWVHDIKNEAGAETWGKVLSQGEIDIDRFSKVQSVLADDYAKHGGMIAADGFPVCGAGKLGEAPFGNMAVLGDDSFLHDLLQKAQYGANGIADYIGADALAELEKVATQARFVAKADGTFVTAIDKSQLKGILEGDTAVFGAGRYVGTNYSQTLADALKNGIVGESEGAVCIVRVPAGNRYAKLLVDEQPAAMLLPNSRYKVVSTEVKTIVQGGKATKVTHYTLEMVQDGSEQVQKVLQVQQQAKADVQAYNKAVKAAENVKKAAAKWVGAGVDMSDLEFELANGNTAAIKHETKALAQAINKAKKDLQAAYGGIIDNPVQVYLQHGKPSLESVFNAVQDKVSKWHGDWNFTQPNKWQWLKKNLEFEIQWVEDKKAYSTWKVAQAAYKKLLAQVENKIMLQPLEADIAAALAFVSKSSKVKALQADLQTLYTADTPNEPALKSKLAEVQKEIDRLNKERSKKYGTALPSTTSTMETLTKEQVQQLLDAYQLNDVDEVDDAMRSWAAAVWGTLTEEEKWVLTKYTQTYSYLNEPLRGLTYYGSAEAKAAFATDRPLLEKALSKFRTPESMVVRRGTDSFPIPELGYSGLGELKVGDEWVDGGFLSTAAHRSKGFSREYNLVIVVPKGSQGAYAEVFSHYNGDSYNYGLSAKFADCKSGGYMHLWDAKEKWSFGGEFEWIGQRGCKFKVLRKQGKTIYMQLVSQLHTATGVTL